MANTILIIGATLFTIYFLYNHFFAHPKSNLITLLTPWGEKLDKNKILPEYPRPQYKRESYLNLNGIWNYALRNNEEKPKEYDGHILVPFSIESPLSGVEKKLNSNMFLWYNRKVNFSEIKNEGRYLLNFGAVDQIAEVYINNVFVGKHEGGYLSFGFDITEEVLKADNITNVDLTVKVVDNWRDNGEAYGKQSKSRGNIWYVQTGGIWQTVWIESVPENYLQNVKITPLYDENKIELFPEFIFYSKNNKNEIQKGKYIITDKIGRIIEGEFKEDEVTIVELPKKIFSWSPEEPNLYKVKFIYGKDIIDSYFAMRKFSIEKDQKGINRLFLNNKQYFHNGLLDQGYWSDGYYTAPSDEALKYDIIKMKEMGFNMLRKHIKVESMRWYYHCDTLGMLVWQDMISGGSKYNPLVIQFAPFFHISIPDNWYSLFGRETFESRQTYYRELEEMINQLYNVPSISTWVPFNEGWGQFDALKAVDFIKNIDSSRYIDHASGWHDQYGGDFLSLHIYSKDIEIENDKYNRTIVLSEFGGYSFAVKNHCGSDNQFGYSKFNTIEEYRDAYSKLFINQIIPAIAKGLSATVYTQVSDVEDEVNGLLSYDRKIIKVDLVEIKSINEQIQYLNNEKKIKQFKN